MEWLSSWCMPCFLPLVHGHEKAADAVRERHVEAPNGLDALPTFESLWNMARAGDLKVGDRAPDFRLQTYDKSTWVQLSSFHGDRPVALIFGSYT